MSRKLIDQLVRKHGKRLRDDITRGVKAARKVWPSDGSNGLAASKDFEEFCLAQYVPPARRGPLLERLDEFHQAVAGAMEAAYKNARAGQDIADRPFLAAEKIFGAYAPDSHLLEDYRRYRIAAIVQLNFGTDDRSVPRSRAGWAARRLSNLGRQIIPAELIGRLAQAQSEVDVLISSYNLHLDRFDFGDPRIRFPKGTKLVSHWGLRDTMTALHGTPHALIKRKAILDLMRRVVDGEIPEEVLNRPEVRWDIPRGRISAGPGGRGAASWKPAKGHGALRWRGFHKVWQVHRQIDPYRRYGNLIDNKFLSEREIPEEKVVGILIDVLSSPLAERVAHYLRDQLGRELEPFDIYYRDFSPRKASESARGKQPLKFDIRGRYPDAASLGEAITDVLVRFGWKRDRARWIRSRIRVDNGRSAGHAWPPRHENDLQLLRVRVDKRGCDELHFETFMHELGHCVEGVLTTYEMDYRALWGVPNTAFTEGFAFTFQDRTDEILGRGKRPRSDAVTLRRFWEPFEIAGPALTEIRFFHWLYKHAEATPEEMMRAVRRIGDAVWKEFYARIFGAEGHGLMSVYSHMLWGDFYLAEYPMGLVMAYQIRKHLEGKPLPVEMERMCRVGRIYPEEWMKTAVGQKISVRPLLDDTKRALERLGY